MLSPLLSPKRADTPRIRCIVKATQKKRVAAMVARSRANAHMSVRTRVRAGRGAAGAAKEGVAHLQSDRDN
jgi:hypothetical protein